MAELANFNAANGVVGDTCQGWKIEAVIDAPGGKYRWTKLVESHAHPLATVSLSPEGVFVASLQSLFAKGNSGLTTISNVKLDLVFTDSGFVNNGRIVSLTGSPSASPTISDTGGTPSSRLLAGHITGTMANLVLTMSAANELYITQSGSVRVDLTVTLSDGTSSLVTLTTIQGPARWQGRIRYSVTTTTPNETFTIPLTTNASDRYSIDWGDGSLAKYGDSLTHTYAVAGTYVIDFRGNALTGPMRFTTSTGGLGSSGDGDKITWLSNVDLDGFAGFVDASYLFNQCGFFNSDIKSLSFKYVTNASYMFNRTLANQMPLETLELPEATNVLGMFQSTSSTLRLTFVSLPKATQCGAMFRSATFAELPIRYLNLPAATNTNSMFATCSSATLPLKTISLPLVTDCSYMFSECETAELPLRSFSAPLATLANGIFQNCFAAKLPLTGSISLPEATQTGSLFLNCYSALLRCSFGFPKTTALADAFNNCHSFVGHSAGLTAPLCTLINRLFAGCKSFSGSGMTFTFGAVTSASGVFGAGTTSGGTPTAYTKISAAEIDSFIQALDFQNNSSGVLSYGPTLDNTHLDRMRSASALTNKTNLTGRSWTVTVAAELTPISAANTVRGNATAANAVVTDIAVAASRLLGRGATGNLGALTPAQARSLLRGTSFSMPYAATVSFNLNNGLHQKLTAAGNFTLPFAANAVEGETVFLYVTQDGTGSRLITWNSAYKFAGGTALTLSTAANAVDRIEIFFHSATAATVTITKDIK